MKPAAERALEPKLRFPEFRDAGEWEEKKLSSMVQLISGLHLSPDQYGNEGSVPYFTGPSDFTGKTQKISKWTRESTSIAIENDTLITVKGNGVGDIWYLTLPRVAMGRQLMAVRSTNSSSLFIYQFLLTKRTRFEDLASGNLIPGLSRGDILDLEARFPLHPEQQKIADCLSSIDELVTLEAQKLDTLKAHKKGLMQQLFPAEGETLPKLRFPEFRDAGEWKEKKLGEIGDVLMCKRIFANETNDSSGIPFYKIGTLGGKPDAFISNKLFNEYKSKYNFPRKGEILITCSGTVGKCLPYDGKDAYYQDSNIVWINNSILEISNEFLYYLLTNVNWEKLNSTTITRIYGDDLRSLPLVFPVSEREQNEIVDFFSSIDELITVQAQKLDTLKAHKKGLMQQLFPALDEVQG